MNLTFGTTPRARGAGRLLAEPAVFALLALLAAAPLRAQSLDAGALSGVVRDSSGALLPEASITLTERVTGVVRSWQTPRTGAYAFSLLLPGDYDLLVERFGYRPRFIRAVPVRAGTQIIFDVVLAEAGRAGVDSVPYPGATPGGLHLVSGTGTADDQFASMADRGALMTGVHALLPGAIEDGTAEGLPARFGALSLDGVARWSARHPRLASAGLDGIAFPLAGVHGIELLPGGMDAEWSSAGGGLLAGFSVPGSRRTGGVLTVSGGPDAQLASLLVSGPAVRDTAHYAFGIAVARLNPNLGAPWEGDSLAAGYAATARDSFTTDFSPYQSDWKPSTLILSGFGRFDWILARDHRVTLRASGASVTGHDPSLAPSEPAAIGSDVTAKDLSVGGLITSTLGQRLGNEFKVALDAGNRDYTAARLGAANLPGTFFTENGMSAGTSGLLPGHFSRTSFFVSETAHLRLPFGALKLGFQFGLNSFSQEWADNRAGTWWFGDSLGFASRTGGFAQTVGSTPLASFKTQTMALFLQGLLRPTSALEIVAGLRYEAERLPTSQIRRNTEWLRLTGIDTKNAPKRALGASPRVAFTWTPGASRRWQLSGEAGRFQEASDPGILAEVITHSTGQSVRRGFGTLGDWPAVPDSTGAPVRGDLVSVLGPSYDAPRTSRARFGITGNIRGTAVRLQFAYRHTDYLPLRRDLNLPVSPNGRTQDGRALYGPLVKSGTLVMAQPGGNRRFANFDAVMTLDPAAASDYYGFTLAIQRVVTRGISLLAAYTYSRTEDNWFGARAASADAQLVPLFDSTGASPWADGRSDFDVPHRIVLGTELRFGERARLLALYRRRSGYPFTPGYRDGVDINGDGSGRNDPAFVTDTLPGAIDVVSANGCLGSQVGQLAERNSCREPWVSWLDLRFVTSIARVRGGPVELLVDALGLVATGQDVTDHALYLVDRAVPLATAGAVTTIPLVANPNFGKTLTSRTPGASFRVGLRVGF